MENDIICIYCNKPWSQEMLEELKFCEGSYTPDCVGSEFVNSKDINCSNCNKLIYKKEFNTIAEIYDQKRWS